MTSLYKPDMLLDGRFRLMRQLESNSFYIETWLAQAGDKQLVVKLMRSIVTDDDAPWNEITLHNKMQALVRDLNLISQPQRNGLTPWLECLWLNDLKSLTLLLSRPYYEKRLLDNLTLETFASRSARNKLFEQLEILADSLEQQYPTNQNQFVLLPTNIMIDENDNWIITDHGILSLYRLVTESFDGPRPFPKSQSHQYFWYNTLGWAIDYPFDNVDVQYMLATLYFYLRFGHGVFEKIDRVFNKDFSLDDNRERVKTYKETGVIELEEISNLDERNILERALSSIRENRFASAKDFVQTLKNSIMSH